MVARYSGYVDWPGPWLKQCLFANLFRPVTLDPASLTADVALFAGAIDAGRGFDRLPVLADALEEAGCDHIDILAHCRGNGLPARGCWVVDLLTGRA